MTGIIAGILLLVIGLTITLKPDAYVKFQKWQTQKLLKAKLVTTKDTIRVYKALGIVSILAGIIIIAVSAML